MVFRRSQQSQSTANDDAPEVSDAAPAGKGRPTPTRKEAEAARKQSLKVPSDPKAAKKALRERERAERQHQREALMRGDESALPPRDRGPAKAFVRNWVDSRRLFSEWFIFLALAVLLLSLIPNQTLRGIVNLSWVVMLIVVIADTSFTTLTITTLILAGLTGMSAAPTVVAIPEQFPMPIRALGLSVVYAVGVAVFGGSAQAIVTWLIAVTGSPAAPALYVVASSIITVIAIVLTPETGGKAELRH